MAFFNNSSNASRGETAGMTGASETIITSCIEITGNIKGCGTLHIYGTLHGDLEIEEGVVIGENGKVFGNITTGNLIVSGTVEGQVICEHLDVTRTGTVSNDIQTNTLRSDGTLKALIFAKEEIDITANGNVTTDKMYSKHITVNGSVKGNITAAELLEINQDGSVEGEMTIAKIKVAEGGMMLGQMQTYQSELNPNQYGNTHETDSATSDIPDTPSKEDNPVANVSADN
jgi:cytoskeletal protein CcmA (bactofilin family)